MTVARPSGRAARPAARGHASQRGFTRHAEGSVLVAFGDTRVLCTASVENRVPPFLRGKGEGWVTAEYGMLPRATHTRTQREAARGKQGGRTLEIQRLIGRALRACVDRSALGERTITLDCDVLQADGGTRTAAITGAYVALVDAVRWLQARATSLKRDPVFGAVAAVSVGIYRGVPVLDLDYAEDSGCDTDMNVVMNDGGGFIELQGTAEGHAFRRDELDALLALARKGHRRTVRARSARRWPRRVTSSTCNASSSPAATPASCAEICATLLARQRASSCIAQSEFGVARRRGNRRDLRRERAAQGAPRRARDRPAGARRRFRPRASTRSAARRACIRRATPARHGDARRTSPSCSTRCDGVPDDAAQRALPLRARAAAHADDPQPLIAEGRWHGRILARAARRAAASATTRCSSIRHTACSAAELDPASKNRVSHRGQALARLQRR